jgi:sugar/nucleoside kinase (ribokinase family)
MCTYLGAANQLTEDDVDPEVIRQAEIVYLEGYLFDPPAARQAFGKAAAIARDAGRRIALTLSDAFVVERHRDELLSFIGSDVDLVFANEAEVASLFRTRDFDQAVRQLGQKAELAAVTRSERGSVVLSREGAQSIPAAPVPKVVDTTGAGDQYAAGFLFGLARGRPLAICGQLGSLAAAEVIGHYGPRPLTPLKDLAGAAGLLL